MIDNKPPTPRILVVEDTDDFAELLVQQIKQMGFQDVETCSNGLEAYNACVQNANNEHPFSLIISDLKMPKMTGVELLRKVRTNTRLQNTPFIMISGFGEEQLIRDALKLKIDGFITKPHKVEALQEKIKTSLARHRS